MIIAPGALTQHLLELLGEEQFVRLTQELGGQRLYVPYNPRDDSELVQVLGPSTAAKLCREMAPATIRVPLARYERAMFYRAQGLSDARIARRLGMSEHGVWQFMAREAKRVGGLPPRPRRADKRQAELPLS